MIQRGTVMLVADNSGASLVRCIGVKDGSWRRYAYVGDVVKVSIRKAAPRTIEVGTMSFAVVVRTRHSVKRASGETIHFSDNAVVLLNSQMEPSATRVLGPICSELRTRFPKIVSLAPEVY